MPSFDNWLGVTGTIDETVRAICAWNRIGRDSTSLELYRDATGTTLDAQTVRVEMSELKNMPGSEPNLARGATRDVVVFGVVNHPTQDDTDIHAGDRFLYEGDEFVVRDVNVLPGEVQAYCERTA
jgi:hypothetical protein